MTSLHSKLFLRACSTETSIEDLGLLSIHEDSSVRWAVAANPKTHPNILLSLVADKDETVYEEAARNPNTPPLARLWAKCRYGKMTLKEFLEASQ